MLYGKYEEVNIYNMDETSLFWQQALDASITGKQAYASNNMVDWLLAKIAEGWRPGSGQNYIATMRKGAATNKERWLHEKKCHVGPLDQLTWCILALGIKGRTMGSTVL